MLQQDEADDYVIATGETHSIREFLDLAFAHVGIDDWAKHVTQDPRFMRPAEVELLIGDASQGQGQARLDADGRLPRAGRDDGRRRHRGSEGAAGDRSARSSPASAARTAPTSPSGWSAEGMEVHALVLEADGHPAHCPDAGACCTPATSATSRRPDGSCARSRRDEVYNLAGISSVAQSWEEPDRTAHVNGLAAVALLESARQVGGVRLVQASSAEIFGEPATSPQTEDTADRAGQPLRRREGVRPPVRPRLPPARPARVERDPLQPRVAAAARRAS